MLLSVQPSGADKQRCWDKCCDVEAFLNGTCNPLTILFSITETNLHTRVVLERTSG